MEWSQTVIYGNTSSLCTDIRVPLIDEHDSTSAKIETLGIALARFATCIMYFHKRKMFTEMGIVYRRLISQA